MASDATERFATGLKTSVETDGNNFGTDGKETDDGFEEDADDVFHLGERNWSCSGVLRRAANGGKDVETVRCKECKSRRGARREE